MAPPGRYPIQRAMADLGVEPRPENLPFGADEFLLRIGRLPLIHQPGERWIYHTGADILAALIPRIVGIPLEAFLRERLFDPLGMRDTGFSVPPDAIGRLATCYEAGPNGADLQIWDEGADGAYARPPAFETELVSTVDDYHAFFRMLMAGGRHDGRAIVSSEAVRRMMTDHITPEQKALSPFFPGFWDRNGWGFGGAVVIRNEPGHPAAGSYGWNGGLGTSAMLDPSAGMITILLTQRLMRGPGDAALHGEIQRLAASNRC